jgi:hypothetical protein
MFRKNNEKFLLLNTYESKVKGAKRSLLRAQNKNMVLNLKYFCFIFRGPKYTVPTVNVLKVSDDCGFICHFFLPLH